MKARARSVLVVTLAGLLLMLGACADNTSAPDSLREMKYDLVPHSTDVKQVFQPTDPIALLTIPSNQSTVVVLGRIHGWPFPHEDPTGEFGEGMFCYRIDATETTADPADAKLPASAKGTRQLYFFPGAQPHTFSDPASFVAGQQVIRDSVEMALRFNPDHSEVTVTMNVHRVGVEPFVYKGETVHPPERSDHTVVLAGAYSADLGGYLLRNVTRESPENAAADSGPS